MPHAGHFLIRLMALAGDQYDVVRAGHADGLVDGGRTVALHDRRIRTRKPAQDIGNDPIAIFAARIIVGDDRHIGGDLGNGGHLRALAGVAFAAATEHADQPVLRMRTQAGERLFQCVRRVCVVHHHQRRAMRTTQAIHAAVDRLQATQHLGDLRRCDVERVQRAGHGQQVIHVETAQQRRVHRVRRFADVQRKLDSVVIELQILRLHRGTGLRTRAHADGAQCRIQRRKQRAAEGVVQVHDRCAQPGACEQLGLGRTVLRHVAVIIEMVAGEIGEHRHVELHRIHAALIECMRTDFHRHRLRAGIAQLRELGVGLQHQRRGEAGRHRSAVQAHAQRANGAGGGAEQRQRLRQQLHR